MIATDTPSLSVKELAERLGRSTRYVYGMRQRGFPMTWDWPSHCYVATEPAARAWIEKKRFRLVRGKERVGPQGQSEVGRCVKGTKRGDCKSRANF